MLRFWGCIALALISPALTAKAGHAAVPLPSYEATWATAAPGDDYQSGPWGIASTRAGDLVVADTGAHAIKRFSPTGTLLGSWKQEDFIYPRGLAIDGGGDIFAASSDRVWRLSAELEPRTAWSREGSELQLWGLAVDDEGSVYVTDRANDRVAAYSADGRLLRTYTGSGDARIARPFDVAVAPDGRVFVLNDTNAPPLHAIVVFSRGGEFLGALDESAWQLSDSPPFPYPKGIAVGADGRIYVADAYQSRVFILSPAGVREGIVGAPGRDPGQFRSPADVDVDCHGNLAVTDVYLGRVTLFSAGTARGSACPPPPKAAPPQPLFPPETPTGPPAAGSPLADKRPPALSVRARPHQRLGRRPAVAVVVRCDEDCVVSAKGVLQATRPRWRRALPVAGAPVRPNMTLTMRATIPARAEKRIRTILRRRGRVSVRVAVSARDKAGNRSATRIVTVALR